MLSSHPTNVVGIKCWSNFGARANIVVGGEITLRQLGSTVGSTLSWVKGSPEFFVGEKVFLFLSSDADGSAPTGFLSIAGKTFTVTQQ